MRRHGEAAGVALVVVGVIAAYAWSAHIWVDPVDEGYFLDLGQRVLDGAVPYRDFTTYYTPGIFYLFAVMFKLFGTNLLVIRYLFAILRGLTALLLYGLTRRVAPWPLAWLPFVIVFALDRWPIEPEPHPSWPAIVACLLSMELIVRHLTSGRVLWLALAGLAAGVAYLFKQNVGAFVALAIAGYVLLRPRTLKLRRSMVALRGAQVLYTAAAMAAITYLMWSNMDPLTAAALWLPALVTLGMLLFRAVFAPPLPEGSVVAEAVVPAAIFSLVTVAWLVPLMIAIGPGQTPLALFVGDVDQAALAEPFDAFSPGSPWLLLAVVWLAIGFALSRRNYRPLVIIGAVLSAIALLLPIWQGPRDPLTFDPLLAPVSNWLDVQFGTLNEYLLPLASWAGIVALAISRDVVGPHPWFLLFGILTALSMYPRSDTLHAVVASPPVLIVGAAALARLWRGAGKLVAWRRVGLIATLLAVPVVALAPQVMWRADTLLVPNMSGPWLDYEALGVARAPVLLPRQMAEDMRGVVDYVQDGTPQGDPFFAYPVDPLFNFLVDRPNPTHFDHYIPGTLDEADFSEVIQELQDSQARYVMWDHASVQLWGTDPANRPLSDYIWSCYQEVTAFRLYLVLERIPGECPAP
jgi:hypothetical protein